MAQCEHLYAKCQMPIGHDDEVKCRFLCPDCGEEFETDEGRCIQQIVLAMNTSMPISANTQKSQPIVPKEVRQAIGEVFIEYALAENTLRTLLQQLPNHDKRSSISEDLNRLEKWLPDILEQTPDVEGLRAEFDGCVKYLRSAFDAVNGKRNTLAHGQLFSVSSTVHTITGTEERIPDEPGGTSWEISHPVHGTVLLTEPEISEVLEAAVKLRQQVGVLAKLTAFR